MSHPEQHAFFSAVAEANRDLVAGGRIIEIGSYDVNGTVRATFGGSVAYTGVDLEDGPGVDVVSFGHEVDSPDSSFDIAISGECFEHDPHWRETFANMVRLTRAGGLVAFTCASSGRPEHGTARTLVTDSPGTQAVGLDYYRNLGARDFDDLPLSEWFQEWKFWYMPTSFDLYFAGVVAGSSTEDAPVGSIPDDQTVGRIRQVMTVPHRLVRLPLRLAKFTVGDGDRYQRTVLPYWRFLLRVSAGRGRRDTGIAGPGSAA
jgi:SAM-dependent methyltransferase